MCNSLEKSVSGSACAGAATASAGTANAIAATTVEASRFAFMITYLIGPVGRIVACMAAWRGADRFGFGLGLGSGHGSGTGR